MRWVLLAAVLATAHADGSLTAAWHQVWQSSKSFIEAHSHDGVWNITSPVSMTLHYPQYDICTPAMVGNGQVGSASLPHLALQPAAYLPCRPSSFPSFVVTFRNGSQRRAQTPLRPSHHRAVRGHCQRPRWPQTASSLNVKPCFPTASSTEMACSLQSLSATSRSRHLAATIGWPPSWI